MNKLRNDMINGGFWNFKVVVIFGREEWWNDDLDISVSFYVFMVKFVIEKCLLRVYL